MISVTIIFHYIVSVVWAWGCRWFYNSWFCLQCSNLVFWNYIDLSTKVYFVDAGPVGIEGNWPLGVCLLGDCASLLVVVLDFILNIKNGTNEEVVFFKNFFCCCFGYQDSLKTCYWHASVGKVFFFITAITGLMKCRANSSQVSSTRVFTLFYYLFSRLQKPIFLFVKLYFVNFYLPLLRSFSFVRRTALMLLPSQELILALWAFFFSTSCVKNTYSYNVFN